MRNEYTIHEKVEKLIESGIFAEDVCLCSDEFINGAFEVLDYFTNNRK